MNKGSHVLLTAAITLAITLASLPIFANGYDQAQLPDLPDYYAYAPSPPPLSEKVGSSFSWLKNFYITAEVGRSYASINSIDNITDVSEPFAPPVAKPNEIQAVNHLGVAIGYQLRNSGIFSRIEIEYLNRAKIDYVADPAIIFSVTPHPTINLNSTVKNQTILGKIYWDFNYGIFVIPYIQAGAGIGFNQTKTSGTFIEPPIIPTPPITSETSSSNTKFAWEGGAGLRIKITKHLFAGIGYEFDSLGTAHWEVATDNPNQPLELKARDIYSQTITIGVTLKA